MLRIAAFASSVVASIAIVFPFVVSHANPLTVVHGLSRNLSAYFSD